MSAAPGSRRTAPAAPQPSAPQRPVAPRRKSAPVWPWVAGSLALAALSLLLPSTPTYDPWAWIVWGREITELNLVTTSGPSWKPLPVLFTIPFGLLGGAAPDLWLVVARAGGLLALVGAYRLAGTLASGAEGAGAERRAWVPSGAGVFAALALFLSPLFLRDVALGSSEGILIALVLWAIERHLCGRPAAALALGFAAALVRPETWPFFLLYAAYVALVSPRLRALAAALLLLIPALWLLPELWGSGDLLRASDRAASPNPDSAAFAERPALAVAGQLLDVLPAVVAAGALGAGTFAAYAFARRREQRTVLVLFGAAVGLVGIVAAMTELGYAGNPRYLAPAVGIGCVLAGVGYAWLATWLAALVAARRRLEPGPRRRLQAGASAATAVAALVVAAPHAAARIPADLETLAYQAMLRSHVVEAVEAAGGPGEVLDCGRPSTGDYQVPLVAWTLGVHGRDVALEPEAPGVVLRSRATGGDPPDPGAPGPPFQTSARSGPWTVLSACE